MQPVGFLWFWCAHHYAPPTLSIVDLMIAEFITGPVRYFHLCLFHLAFVFALLWLNWTCQYQTQAHKLFIFSNHRETDSFFQIFTSRLKKFTSTTTMPTLYNTFNCAFIIFALSLVTFLQPESGGMFQCCLSLLNLLVIGINDRLHSWGICVIPRVFTNRFRYDPLTEPADIHVMEA